MGVLTCLLAGIPQSLCPSSVKATVEGVVLIPNSQEEGQGGALRVEKAYLLRSR